jgi:hypothetical protein
VELISNKHLSSISCMKCRYVGSKYMHFMTANSHKEGSHSILEAEGPPDELLDASQGQEEGVVTSSLLSIVSPIKG